MLNQFYGLYFHIYVQPFSLLDTSLVINTINSHGLLNRVNFQRKTIKMGQLIIPFGHHTGVFGHVVGLAIPAKWIDGLGVSEEMYHFGLCIHRQYLWYNDVYWYVTINKDDELLLKMLES